MSQHRLHSCDYRKNDVIAVARVVPRQHSVLGTSIRGRHDSGLVGSNQHVLQVSRVEGDRGPDMIR